MSEKRRVGRPRTRAEDGPGDYVGFRAPRELKQKLEAAAVASGRSLSTEAQFRIEFSFRSPQSARAMTDDQFSKLLTSLEALTSAVETMTVILEKQTDALAELGRSLGGAPPPGVGGGILASQMKSN